MKFNEKIVVLRRRNGFSQDDLADKVGVSRQSVSKWELGECEPNIEKIKSLAQVFNVTINYLLDDDLDNDERQQSLTNAEASLNKEENKQQNTEKIVYKYKTNYWFIFIIIGFIGLVLCIIFANLFSHQCSAHNDGGIIGYLFQDWCIEGILWKIWFVSSLIMFILGILKTFCTKGTAKRKEWFKNLPRKKKNIFIAISSTISVILLAGLIVLIVFMNL